MDYTRILSACEERKHLISMAPLERIVELGYNVGINEDSQILDFYCRYGTILKIWTDFWTELRQNGEYERHSQSAGRKTRRRRKALYKRHLRLLRAEREYFPIYVVRL